MSINLSFETAFGLFKQMRKFTKVDLDALGIGKEEMELVAQESYLWQIDHTDRVMKVLNSLLFGACKLLRIPQIVVPSEYVAGLISAIVGPQNIMTACIWMAQERQTGVGAMELSARAGHPTQMQAASADQLFALCARIMSTDGAGAYKELYATHMGYAIQQAQDDEMTGEKPQKGKR